jgi:hypothetical protein
MKKFIVSMSAFLALSISSFAFAAEEGTSEQRFYVGIGIQPMQIDNTRIIAIPTSDGKEIKNGQGQLIGKIFVGGRLKNGPAEKAGLLWTDVILAVDGLSADTLGLRGVIEKIADGGEDTSVRLSIGRLDPDGAIVETRDVDIPRATIDRVAWLPSAVVSHSKICSGRANGKGKDECISVKSKFTEDKVRGDFVYWYQMTNDTKHTIRLQWEILDKAVSGSYAMMNLVPLPAGTSRQFILRSKLLPGYADKTVRVFVDTRRKHTVSWQIFKEKGSASVVKSLPPFLSSTQGFGASGYLPEAYINEK